MILIDVNVLLYAYRKENPQHDDYRRWLQSVFDGKEPFAVTDTVLSAVVRLLTHPRVYAQPDTIESAFQYANLIRDHPRCVHLAPGDQHWTTFADLCKYANIKGGMVTDAFFAAIAIEHGCEWITTDRDFARFPGLRWRHPLSPRTS